MKLSDGRKFVTDGACLLDTAVARPPALPKVELSGPAAEMVERNFKAPTKTEVPYADLAGGERPGTYRAPNGTVLSARYVDYLRGAIGASELRFRVQGDRDATVVVSGATPVGLLMPMAR